MKVTIPMTLALATAMTAADARSHGRAIIAPRDYQFNRGDREAFDMVSEIFSHPMYNMANSLLRQSHQGSAGGAAASPLHYDVSQDRATGVVTLRMELPGVSAQELQVELENASLLRIRGSRPHMLGGPQTAAMEFDQSFQLDEDVDPASLQVTLQNGILQVSASKKETIVQRLEIHTADQGTTVADSADVKTTEQDGLTITEETD
jgi:HSP20 family molecular chaperone IbpA